MNRYAGFALGVLAIWLFDRMFPGIPYGVYLSFAVALLAYFVWRNSRKDPP